ncbi:unnamed protein product [Notodromas monacha]|uniref:Ig-like domain-containing protein n=1 Tax=Notodromas monacha TaxID=399045 RepID=A0A7R9GJ82_9CRUS|nr:unnamed protein product [Notodromas monacha]CAG0923362.1 unnamed protein product [Notodromas monacha]
MFVRKAPFFSGAILAEKSRFFKKTRRSFPVLSRQQQTSIFQAESYELAEETTSELLTENFAASHIILQQSSGPRSRHKSWVSNDDADSDTDSYICCVANEEKNRDEPSGDSCASSSSPEDEATEEEEEEEGDSASNDNHQQSTSLLSSSSMESTDSESEDEVQSSETLTEPAQVENVQLHEECSSINDPETVEETSENSDSLEFEENFPTLRVKEYSPIAEGNYENNAEICQKDEEDAETSIEIRNSLESKRKPRKVSFEDERESLTGIKTSEIMGKNVCRKQIDFGIECGDQPGSQKLPFDTSTKPVIITKSLDTEGIETEEIVLEVKADGVPRPSIRWFIGEMEIEETYRIKKFEDDSDNTYQLRIAALKAEDAGEYECVVENMLGEARLKGKVTVKTLKELRHPKIMANLIDQTVMKGEPFRLKASIRGEPTPEVHWFKDGKIANETDGVEILRCEDGFTYEIAVEKASEKHHGMYEVSAKNEWGEAESQATVTVLIKPEIYEIPNVQVDHSDNVTISGTVVANPKPKITWLKNGEPWTLDAQRMKAYEEATDTHSLVIKQLIDIDKTETNDGANYTLVAENEHGKREQTFKLHINQTKPIFLVPVTDFEIGVGDSATLFGKVTGIPKPTLKWTKDGSEVEYSDQIVEREGEDQSYELFFKEVKKEDFGMYTLTATNLFGVAESTAELSLPKSPPKVLEELQPRMRVKEGEPMVLQMKFDKLSGSEVKWYKDGHPVIPDGRIRIESLPDGTQKLIIDQTIRRLNLVGEGLNGPFGGKHSPYCLHHLHQLPVLNFNYEPVGGTPFPDASWNKNGVPLTSHDAARVNIINQNGKEFYKPYTCKELVEFAEIDLVN